MQRPQPPLLHTHHHCRVLPPPPPPPPNHFSTLCQSGPEAEVRTFLLSVPVVTGQFGGGGVAHQLGGGEVPSDAGGHTVRCQVGRVLQQLVRHLGTVREAPPVLQEVVDPGVHTQHQDARDAVHSERDLTACTSTSSSSSSSS